MFLPEQDNRNYEKLHARDCGQPTFTSSKLNCALDELLINLLESNYI